jgi:hypothetical protein
MSASGVNREQRFVSRGRRAAAAAEAVREYRVGDIVTGKDILGVVHEGKVVEINETGPIIETDREKWK